MTKKTQKCDKCGKNFVIKLAYGPHYFCEEHFTQFFESRFRKTIRKYALLKNGEKLVVALSGGKDSVVTLLLLHKFYSKTNPIEALIIDEGVKGYRNKAVKTAVDNCKALGVDYKVVSFEKEFGLTNDELMPLILKNPKLGGTCAFCGTLRRTLMNKYAKEMKGKKLVTGHNLDDEVQSVIMNVFNNDYDKFKRQDAGTGEPAAKGFVKRIKPLYETPEKEVIAYCAFNKIDNYSNECCPYSWTAKRNEFREMINNFEQRFPGTEFSILRFFETVKKDLPTKDTQNGENKSRKSKLKDCKSCGEPTEKDLCNACSQIEKILYEKGKSKGRKRKKGTKYNKCKTCKTTKGI